MKIHVDPLHPLKTKIYIYLQTKKCGDSINRTNLVGIGFAAAVVSVLFTALLGLPVLAYASSSNTVSASVSIPSTCLISGAGSINLGAALTPATNYPTSIAYTVNDPGGNAPANILVAASGNWISGSNTIFYGNVIWNPTTGSSTGNALTQVLTNTLIQIPAPNSINPTTSAQVFFGIQVPFGQAAGLYTSNILFENSCQPSNSVTLTVPTTANVLPYCYISLGTYSISFGTISPGSNSPTSNVVAVNDPGGNVQANVLVDGTDWTTGSSNFGVSNTLWNPTSLGTYAGNALTNALAPTSIIIPAPSVGSPTTSNNIYFGLGVPAGTTAGAYTQNILIENSC